MVSTRAKLLTILLGTALIGAACGSSTPPTDGSGDGSSDPVQGEQDTVESFGDEVHESPRLDVAAFDGAASCVWDSIGIATYSLAVSDATRLTLELLESADSADPQDSLESPQGSSGTPMRMYALVADESSGALDWAIPGTVLRDLDYGRLVFGANDGERLLSELQRTASAGGDLWILGKEALTGRIIFAGAIWQRDVGLAALDVCQIEWLDIEATATDVAQVLQVATGLDAVRELISDPTGGELSDFVWAELTKPEPLEWADLDTSERYFTSSLVPPDRKSVV